LPCPTSIVSLDMYGDGDQPLNLGMSSHHQ